MPDDEMPEYLHKVGRESPESKWLTDNDGCDWPNPYFGNPHL